MARRASSEAAWAFLTEGVTKARLDVHRLRHMMNRASRLVEDSPEREHLYEVAGDIIVSMPRQVEKLERSLDRTSLALSKMGETFLSARLPLSDKTDVNEAVSPAFGGGMHRAERVAQRWLEARAKVSPQIRREYAKRTRRVGLDGNGRFRSIGQAMNAITGLLAEDYKFGRETRSMELADVPSADLFRADSGQRMLRIAFRGKDPFSPQEIENSMVVIQWYKLDDGRYEVLSYLS